MTKIDANEYVADARRLAETIRAGGWRPDLILAIWRGGALPAIVVHECLKAEGWPAVLRPVVCESYSPGGGAGAECVRGEPKWIACSEVFASIRPGMKVLAIDDIYDSGGTVESLRAIVSAAGADFRAATIYRNPRNAAAVSKPDWWMHDTSGDWLLFPHEQAAPESRPAP